MRLIDADILAEEIKSLKISIAGNPATWDEAKADILQVIDEQPTVDAADVLRNQWISVKDRLPEEDEKCIFFAKESKEAYIGRYAFRDRNGNVFLAVRNGKFVVLGSATNWLPMPEPPEEDKP